MLTKPEAKKLIDAILQRCGHLAAEIMLSSTETSLTRFANNFIHQNVRESNTSLTLRVIDGKRIGTATGNRTDTSGLDTLVERARGNAQAGPENPDFAGLAPPANYPPVQAFDELTAGYSPQDRASKVGTVCRQAAEGNLSASGAFSTGATSLVIANSEGVFAYLPRTRADFQATVMGEDASGRAQGSHWQAGEIPVESLGQEAIQKANLGRNPRKIEPGRYTVVFAPYVVDDILGSLNFYGMSAQAVQEGRSWMNSRLGKQVFSPMIDIWDDGRDPRGFPLPFDFEGVPKQRVDIVKEGLVLSPVYDRQTARKEGKSSTGHAMPATMRYFSGPLAINLFLAPGEASTEALIRSTKRGLYVSWFWYTRLVSPPDCIVTGMTRDGTFMIENGELAYPVKNLRFTQSYAEGLANVEAVGSEERLIISEFGGLSARVPALKISGWNFTGSTV